MSNNQSFPKIKKKKNEQQTIHSFPKVKDEMNNDHCEDYECIDFLYSNGRKN